MDPFEIAILGRRNPFYLSRCPSSACERANAYSQVQQPGEQRNATKRKRNKNICRFFSRPDISFVSSSSCRSICNVQNSSFQTDAHKILKSARFLNAQDIRLIRMERHHIRNGTSSSSVSASRTQTSESFRTRSHAVFDGRRVKSPAE
jgi:hypothetical protein